MSISVQNFVNSYYDQHIAGRTFSADAMDKSVKKHANTINQRVQQVGNQRDVAASVSISKEGREKLMGEEAEKALREGCDLIYKSVDKSDVFALQEGDKWQVFSDYLDASDAYAQTGLDRASVQDAMRQTTVNGGALAGESVYTDGNGKQLDSSELSLLHASSVAALQTFSDSFLTGDVKTGFDELISRYDEHLSKQMEGYQSVEEEFNHALASLDDSAKANLENFRTSEGISDSNRMLIGLKEKLGGVSHTAAQRGQYESSLKELLKNMNSSNMQDSLEQMRQKFLSYASGNGSDSNVKNYVSGQSQWVLASVEQTWKKLVGLKQV